MKNRRWKVTFAGAVIALSSSGLGWAGANAANQALGSYEPSSSRVETAVPEVVPIRVVNANGCSTAQIAQAISGGVSDCPGHWAAYPGTEPDSPSPSPTIASPSSFLNVVPSTTAGSCIYETDGDYAHGSKSAGEVSAHGWWWNLISPPTLCPAYADVEVWLQAVWTDGWGNYYWVTVADNTQRIRPKNIYTQDWTNARVSCVSSGVVGFRSIIDVDLVDWSDPPDQKFTNPQNLACVPPSFP